MKYIVIIAIFLTSCSALQEKKYCGKVIERYRINTNNINRNHLVLHFDTINKNVDLVVSSQTYVNTDSFACFVLTDYQINN